VKAAELRDFDDEALAGRLLEEQDNVFKLRFQHVTGQLDNYARITDARRDVARILTEIRAREIAAAEAEAVPGEENE
jgi:large subunit ribosomal protein L29